MYSLKSIFKFSFYFVSRENGTNFAIYNNVTMMASVEYTAK